MKRQFRGILSPTEEFYVCDFGGHEKLINKLTKDYEYFCYTPYNIFENKSELQSSFIYFNYYYDKNEIQFDNSFFDFTNNQLAWLMRNFNYFHDNIKIKILVKIEEIKNK